MLRACILDFDCSWEKYLPLVEFAYNNSYQTTIGMAPCEALYCNKCRFLVHWDEIGKAKLLGPKIVQQTTKAMAKIQERMKTIQSGQKSYVDVRHKNLEFGIREKAFLKVAPIKSVMRFGKKGKLSPRCVDPFKLLERVKNMAYKLALPPAFARIHDMFHVSTLRKYVVELSHILDYEPL